MLFELPNDLRTMIWEHMWDDVAREEGRRAMLAPIVKELHDEYIDPENDDEKGQMLLLHWKLNIQCTRQRWVSDEFGAIYDKYLPPRDELIRGPPRISSRY